MSNHKVLIEELLRGSLRDGLSQERATQLFDALKDAVAHRERADARLARAEKIIAEQRAVIEKINNQAVCFNMDGDAGNERMLRDIATISEAALALTLDEEQKQDDYTPNDDMQGME